MLYSLRYRKAYGVAQSFIEVTAGTPEAMAEEGRLIGEAYCAKHPGYRYISVEPAIVADKSILEPVAPPAADKPDAPVKGKAKAGRIGE